ncbi:MAG: alkaline phosphatase family protein, partial [Gallionellaceae bacterium]|nr:alkaline phosphatase family protein [Gallionellaceae bacterium]
TNAAEKYALMYQANTLANRYAYATAKLDRGDLYPDNLAVTGGDPRLVGLTGTSTATQVAPTQTQAKITFAQSQQAAFNIEGVPAYDNIFVIVEENKSSGAMLGNARVPYMNALLSNFNQLTTYYSTGNPSEPNYTALGGGDDYGITDDSWWGCGATEGTIYAITDKARAASVASDGQAIPANDVYPTAGGVAGGPQNGNLLAGWNANATNVCGVKTTATGTVHNIPGANLFTLLSSAGLTARTYSESMNPGQDARADSVAEAITATYQGSYTADDLLSQAAITANPSLTNGVLTGSANHAIDGGLYKVKHGPSIAWQDARNLPEFFADNRTIFGTQYQQAEWSQSTAYPGYDKTQWVYDQFSKDLDSGDVGNVNFVVPDQCDDMHGVGNDSSCSNANAGNTAGATRADIYLQKVVAKIRQSALWNNPQKRVAIVVVFDEGEGTTTACCGWNANNANIGQRVLTVAADGTVTVTTPANYRQGNHGHGQSIFAVMTNQQDKFGGKKGVVDSDSYSHFSMVRTLQDMFQLADPAIDATYLNRAKYTELFIAQNILNLPELAGSTDTHFDSVRPINHAYVIPATYVQKLNPADYTSNTNGAGTTQTGPDKSQDNVWGPAR